MQTEESFFICFRCKGRINIKGYEKRLKEGKLKRVNIKGYGFKTFHDYCVKNYAKDNPDWFEI